MGQSVQSREDLLALAKRIRKYARAVNQVFYAEKLIAVAQELETRAQTLAQVAPHVEWRRAEEKPDEWEPGIFLNLLT